MPRRVGQVGYWKRTRKHRKRVGQAKRRRDALRGKNRDKD